METKQEETREQRIAGIKILVFLTLFTVILTILTNVL